MRRFVAWVGTNADGLFALILAGVVALLVVMDAVSVDQTDGAILLVLAVLAATLLRDRPAQRTLVTEMHDLAEVTSDVHGEFHHKLTSIEDHLDDSKVALENLSMVRTITGLEVTHALAEARRTTDHWHFKGGTGTYMRAVTLPECVNFAKTGRRPLLLRMEIIDPTNDGACDRYARFRRSLASQVDVHDELWTLDRVRKESYATILAGAWWPQRYHLLDVEIGLSPVMTTLRWDLSSSRLVITQEDPRSPALLVEKGRFYYDRLLIELRTSHEQTRKVPLDLAKSMTLDEEEPTVDQVRGFFEQIGLKLPGSFTDRDVQTIVGKVLRPTTIYERHGRDGDL
jgi:hypothetical protein